MATEKKREGSNGQTEIDDKIMKAVEMAMENFGFCPNRIWAAVRNLSGREQNLPKLFPTHDRKLKQMFPDESDQGDHENDRKDEHSRCNFDFCQQSQTNFTSVEQRHESPSCEQLRRNKLRGCDPLKDLFPRDILDKAVEKGVQGEPTAWQLNGRCIIESSQKFMAISHVWSDGTGTGAWDGFRVNRCLYHFFRKIAREFGCEGIWWDTICVPNNKTLRAKALTNMHHNYEKAGITLVHDCFLRNLEWVDAETACLAIVMSPWFSRGWTALELAKSRKEKGTVKVAFKGPVFKDLDDIIATSAKSSRRHQIASQVIFKLRNESIDTIDTIDDLLTVLGSRHTSWLRDMAIISGLLVGCEIKETDSQQDIYQRILLEHCKNVCHGHLFHNLPTISKGFSWCPISLLDMPLASSKTTLSVGQKGEVVGAWKVFPLKSIKKEKYVWKDTHPLIEAKLRSSLKQKDDHRFLVEPEVKSITRALLVKILEETPTKFRCQFVGSMYFHPPEELGGNQAVEVTIANTEGTEEIEAQACNEVKAGTRVQHPDIVEAEEGVRQIVQHQPHFEPHDLNRRMETQAPVDKGKTEAACASEGEGDPNSQNLRLLSEAKNRKEAELVQLIGEGANVDFQDEYGRTPLSLAAKEGKAALVELLLETRKVNIGSKDRDDRTPMSWAAEGGHEAVVKLLLERYDVQYDSKDNGNQTPLQLERYEMQYDSKDNDDQTPLQQAAEGGHEAVVELLAKRFKSQYDSKDKDGRTPLSRAAEGGREAVVRLLLKWYEIDVESKDNDGWTPLWRAAYNGHEAVVKLLVETGNADVEAREKNGWTPLWWAVHKGNEAVVKLLLKTGKADVEARDINGRTPLFQAAGNGNEAMVKLLLKTCKANVEARDKLGQTPLFQAAGDGNEAVVKLLLETYKADVEASDNMGRTPLSSAAGYGHEAVVKLLLETGKADVEARDNFGQTPLSSAAGYGHEAVVKLLLEMGKADVKVRDNFGQTPLRQAAERGNEAVVRLLLETGKVDVEARDNFGQTPLRQAADRGNEAVVKLLLETGKVDVEARDNFGETPLRRAADRGHEAVVKLLQSYRGLRGTYAYYSGRGIVT